MRELLEPPIPQNNKVAGQLSRLASLDLTRATSQTAIIMSVLMGRGIEQHMRRTDTDRSLDAESCMGRGKKNPQAVRRRKTQQTAVESILGYLRQVADCRAYIVHKDPEEKDFLWPEANTGIGARTDGDGPEWGLDLAVCPVDGIYGLRHGYSNGSISVLAGGPRGPNGERPFKASFDATPPPEPSQFPKYGQYCFVLTVSRAFADKYEEAIAKDPPLPSVLPIPSGASSEDVAAILAELSPISRYVRGSVRARCHLTWGTLGRAPSAGPLSRLLSDRARTHVSFGSSVAASLAVFLPGAGIDAFAAVVRKTHAVLIAAAARATGSLAYFFPVALRPPKQTKLPEHEREVRSQAVIAPGTAVYSAEQLVPGNDVFLVATGITDGHVLQGVRFTQEDEVSTETICLRSQTFSRRLIRHSHDLRHKLFRFGDRTLQYDQILHELQDRIGSG